MDAPVSPSPSQRGGISPQRDGISLTMALAAPQSPSHCACIHFPLHIPFFPSEEQWGKQRIAVLLGSPAVLVPPRTCLLSRLNTPDISCLFSHRNVSVMVLFSWSCTSLDAGAAQDVPNLAALTRAAGEMRSPFAASSYVKALTPPKMGNEQYLYRKQLSQQARTIWTLEKASGDEKTR